MFFEKRTLTLTSLALLVALNGCGGGGGGSNGDDPTPQDPDDEPPADEIPSPDAGALIHLDYNTLVDGVRVSNEAGTNNFPVENAFDAPELVPGVEGQALRTDGYSTWVNADLDPASNKTLTVETWVALESYPSDAEVPHAALTPSSFISQRNELAGFSLDINTFGQWGFTVYLDGEAVMLNAPDVFPLYEWVHVAAVVDTPNESVSLYLNGEPVASETISEDSQISYAGGDLLVGKSHTDKYLGIFLVNALNGAFDETRVYPGARTPELIQDSLDVNVAQADGAAHDSLIVPDSRFAGDLQRPQFHAMPPANWTNEPHGLVNVDGRFHMFYQRTPNGPFKTQMHWGHMYSDDLVQWKDEEDALWPTLELSDTRGYDMKGIWSGDVVYENGTAYAFYTNVNHSGPYNPGVALATSDHENLRDWEKQGPIIDSDRVEDFRDPYLWKEGDTWHMIIGARVSGGGGLDYYTSTDLYNWSRKSRFTVPAYSQMDIGSAIWEMPVFEPLGDGKHILVVNPIGGEVGKYDDDKPTRGVYWTGTWENGSFTPDYLTPKNLDVIAGHLSPTVARNGENQLVGIGIVDERRSSQAQLDAGWTHTFSFPREWRLLEDGETLGQSPADDLQTLRDPDSHLSIAPGAVTGEFDPGIEGRQKEIRVEVNPEVTGSQYGLMLATSPDQEEVTRLSYDAERQEVVLNKFKSSLSDQVEDKKVYREAYDEVAFGKPHTFHVFVDGSVVDVFINDSAAFSFRIYPTRDDSDNVYLFSDGGETEVVNVEAWTLRQP
ncbi:sucrose-6-phosphate hydrolase SacC (GH32 family) [Marinimicrobium koreense]|uniref:beta-fructofuranosidase n=1 Tax=Marinimicrobium koreense TaxID=306545 RepID=A0A3N1P896_9GAMM|nr:GH32 C-terminal domain-containing protein [Marinimicrobium koreense]ROQ20946.1 sucrose-6-phosphate hydrolase SacC (GH32 family) [Marinimicrobium koreense]